MEPESSRGLPVKPRGPASAPFSSFFFKSLAAFFLLALFPAVLIFLVLTFGYDFVWKEALALLEANRVNAAQFSETLRDTHLRLWLVGGTIFLLIASGGLFLSYRLSGQLGRLLSAMRKIKDGQFSTFISPESSDEIGEIARELNNMIEQFTMVRERDKELSLAKNEFITIVAHHLRTPLTELRWSLDVLLNQAVKPEERKKYLQRNLDVVEQSIHLVGNLLNAVRIEERRFGFEFEQLDITPLIERAISNFSYFAQSQKVSINFLPPSKPRPVFADSDGVMIVLNNLLSNALTYTLPGGEVTIFVVMDPTGRFLEVSIQDTGIGISNEELGRIFSQFFRAANAKRLQPNGTGLGLYIARNIIERHGGIIRIASELGRGSTFTFTLPTLKEDLPAPNVNFEKFFEDLGEVKIPAEAGQGRPS